MAKKKGNQKQYAVIGLGQFGESLAKTLIEQNEQVLVVDTNMDIINHAAAWATHAVQVDAADEAALVGLGIQNFDVVCVCIGDVEASLLVTLLCKEHNVPKVLAMSHSELHSKMLKRMGADRVTFPEHDAGERTAYNLLSSNILDFITLSPDYGIAEFEVYEEWVGKSLGSLRFRERYNLSVVAIRSEKDGLNISPLASDVIHAEDDIVVIGSEENIADMEKLTRKK